jgi:autotransporter-associated beta strand protein
MGGSGSTNGQLFLTLGAKGLDTTYGGAISDADSSNGKIVNVTKTGGGSQTFSGISTHTGATLVSAGTLLVIPEPSAALLGGLGLLALPRRRRHA